MLDHPDIVRAMLTGYPRQRRLTDAELDRLAVERDWLRTNLSTYIENKLDAGEEPDPYDFMNEYGYLPEAEAEVEREFDRVMAPFRKEDPKCQPRHAS